MSKIKGIVFDLDGTLVDSVDMWSEMWASAMNAVGINVKPAEIKKYIGTDLSNILMGIGHYSEENVINITKESKRIFWDYARKVKAFPEAKEVLNSIYSNGIKIAVASTSKPDWIEYILKKENLYKFIEAYASGAQVKNQKPDPEIFLLAFKRINAKPEEGIVVGDRKTDTIPALRINAFAVLIDRDSYYENYDEKPEADLVINNLKEVIKIIEREQ
jgi:HAD superfamily hydrolase (TIGR01549 family)